ncbi:N-6 DNA methylase [Actinomadura sp. NPDC049382]|uniref:N-6 DNA methylase n=1 Tax=Actinomadura sp. NPDC049382 TaxID=3158220 RepID=UPI0034211FF2
MYLQSVAAVDRFGAYGAYNDELLRLLSGGSSTDRTAVSQHLDGLAYRWLRQTVDVDTRRKHSTFFTGSALRAELLQPYKSLIEKGATVLDPACGAGDLLIQALSLVPRRWPEDKYCNYVERCIYGRDLVSLLVEVAENRLLLQSQLSRGKSLSVSMHGIQTGDGLHEDVPYGETDLVLLNPPFARVRLPARTAWGEGLTSQAAPFTLEVLSRCRPGTRVAAILPDVLRSGSRYQRWRNHVGMLATVTSIKPVGLFDPWTDVDVFIAHFEVSGNSSQKTQSYWPALDQASDSSVRLGEVATVSIGDVVPHRHSHEGPSVPYLTVHDVPVGSLVTSAPSRQFEGRLHQAPFLLVRRTSAPTRRGEKRLAVAMVDEKLDKVAVENHLIVIKPTSEQPDCRALYEALQDSSVTEWLDRRIRTRHLTKAALLELPLPTLTSGRAEDSIPRIKNG